MIFKINNQGLQSSDWFDLGWGLGFGMLEAVPGDSDLQPRQRFTSPNYVRFLCYNRLS